MGFAKFTRLSNSSSSSLGTAPETPISSAEFVVPKVPHTPGLTGGEKSCFRALKKWCWESGASFDDVALLRYCHFYNFDLEKCKEALERNQDNGMLRLQMRGPLKQQVAKCALFPLPGLKSKQENSEVCYFRPSRFSPESTDSSLLIQNLCYVLNSMSTTEDQCHNGVSVLINMKSYSTKLYDEKLWADLIQVLQGNVVPTKVSLLLILNPPTWFGRIWKTIKANMSPAFARNVRLIETEELAEYFGEGCQSYLPDDVCSGWRRTDELVEDYIDRRTYIDKQLAKKKKATHRASLDLSMLQVPLLEA